MLVIGNKKFRNLPEQVGYNTQEIEEIKKQLDGMVVEDHLVVLDGLSGTLTDEEFNTLDAPLSFISYNDRLYIKRAETGSQIIFDSCELLADGVGGTYYALGQWAVTITVSTKEYTIQKHQILNVYSKTQLDSIVSTINSAISAKLNSADLLNKTYPVGAIYASADNTSPAGALGGTWTALGVHYLPKGDLPVSVSDTAHDVPTGTLTWAQYNGSPLGSAVNHNLVLASSPTYGTYRDTATYTFGGSAAFIQPNNLWAAVSGGTAIYLWQRVA